MRNTVFANEDARAVIDDQNIDARLSWREWVIIRRIRLGWTKANLAEACGVGRTQLWRMIECPPSNVKYLPLTQETIDAVENALATAEAQEGAA